MGQSKRRRFSDEYKAEAIARLEQEGMNYSLVATELGLSPHQLKGWHLQALAAGSASALAKQKQMQLS